MTQLQLHSTTFLFILSAIIHYKAKQVLYTQFLIFMKDEMSLFIQFYILYRLDNYSVILQTYFTVLFWPVCFKQIVYLQHLQPPIYFLTHIKFPSGVCTVSRLPWQSNMIQVCK